MNEKGLMGVVDATGNEIIPCKWDEVVKWGRVYRVRISHKYALYSADGTEVLPLGCTQISDLNCWDRALACIGGTEKKNGDGNVFISGGKYGIIDGDGNVVVPIIHKGLYEFSVDGSSNRVFHEGKCLGYSEHLVSDTLKTDCRYLGFNETPQNVHYAGVIDGSTGKEVVPVGLFTIVMQPKSGMVRTYSETRKNIICGYYDIQQNVAITASSQDGSSIDDLGFWTHGDFTGDIAPVNNGKWWFINRQGFAVREGYSSIAHADWQNIWTAHKQDGTIDAFDDENKDVAFLNGYKDVLFAQHEGDKALYSVKDTRGKWGVLGADGQVLCPCEYEKANAPLYNTVALMKDGLWGLVDANGKSLVPCEFTDFVTIAQYNPTNVFVQKGDSLFYNYVIATGKTLEEGFKVAYPFVDGIAWVRPVDTDIENSVLNRGLMSCSEKNFEKYESEFGYLVDTDNYIMFPPVVNRYFIPQARQAILKAGNALSRIEAQRMLLNFSRGDRRYRISETIGAEDWDY